jgi:hypothetical protein
MNILQKKPYLGAFFLHKLLSLFRLSINKNTTFGS